MKRRYWNLWIWAYAKNILIRAVEAVCQRRHKYYRGFHQECEAALGVSPTLGRPLDGFRYGVPKVKDHPEKEDKEGV